MGKMHRQHQVVGDALVAFMLEMVLREPQGVEAERVHLLGDALGLLEHARQMLVRITPLVGRSGVLSPVGKIDVARIHRGEFRDHDRPPVASAGQSEPISHSWPHRARVPDPVPGSASGQDEWRYPGWPFEDSAMYGCLICDGPAVPAADLQRKLLFRLQGPPTVPLDHFAPRHRHEAPAVTAISLGYAMPIRRLYGREVRNY